MAEEGTSRIRILIVDDHPMVREGLRTYLEVADDILVIGDVGSAETALDLLKSLSPDVILLDLVLPGIEGPAAIRALRSAAPSAHVLVLTSFGEPERAGQALLAGATGYLLKTVSPEDLLDAVRQAARGRAVLDVPATPGPSEAVKVATGEALTPRELEILRLLGRGLTNRDIADRLHITVKTVKTHTGRVYEKLGVEDRTQAVIAGAKLGIIDIARER